MLRIRYRFPSGTNEDLFIDSCEDLEQVTMETNYADGTLDVWSEEYQYEALRRRAERFEGEEIFVELG
jgi:hypothetical protein